MDATDDWPVGIGVCVGTGVGGCGVVTTGGFVGTGVGYTRTALIGAGTTGRGLTTLLGRGCGVPVFPLVDAIAMRMAVVACGVTQGFVWDGQLATLICPLGGN